MFIDSHAHLNMKDFRGDLDAVIERATVARVSEMLNVGYDPASIEETVGLMDRYPGIYGAVGTGGAIILVLVSVLVLPYFIALPAVQLVWVLPHARLEDARR